MPPRREIPRLLIVAAPPPGRPVEDGADACLLETVRRALEGAAGRGSQVAVQLRAKDRPGRALYHLGTPLRRITRDAGATLLINGRVDVAHAVGADGVHLPEDGLAPSDVRRLLGDRTLVGVSRHDRPGLERAALQGADYATLSPFAASPGKGPPLGSRAFADAVHGAGLPVLALGGIDAQRVGPAVAAGAGGVAVVRAVLDAPDPAAAVRRLLDALDTPCGGGR
jgi:thiamine-phosphate pyrophosphorylase